MAGLKALMSLAFAGSIGMTLVILACALPDLNSWWPFIVVIFYLLAPLPTMLMKRFNDYSGSGNANMDLAVFITMGIVVSSFALPIIMARVNAIAWTACNFTLCGNIVVYLTFIGFFLTLYQEDTDYSLW
ncbi:leptin receptor-like [Acyrthosiphon pisum]|uniref:ACYPI008627 protein n=3 Tax=Aphidinae TaxID=133076 RepID=C4WSX4_ACYPI|nr:leptin receptor-like [Acyrthosiphon pisum]XP_025191379.1 leptin receptor gene-related protein isoform X1 [Melanaphis sacchari]BAH70994.1 ACYPI008627 [Acyrthosiphon pisum]|eukprot:NP_001156269.1 leptin receptor-like [Acyrthosiphon pisum]